MLDQNTDRMWYVIGAILIGAAVLFGMNTLFPTAFASVSENMVHTLHEISIPSTNLIKDPSFKHGVSYYHLEPAGSQNPQPVAEFVEDDEKGSVVRITTHMGNQGLFYRGYQRPGEPNPPPLDLVDGGMYRFEVTVRADNPTEVGIAIDGSQLSRADIHTIDNEWQTLVLTINTNNTNTRPRIYTTSAGVFYIDEMSMYLVDE